MCGCHSWVVVDHAVFLSPEPPKQMRLHLAEGATIMVEGASVIGDSIHAGSETVAVDNVREVEVRRFDWGQTMGLIFVTVVPAFFVTLLALGFEMGWFPGGG
jgi:hypothetical protein